MIHEIKCTCPDFASIDTGRRTAALLPNHPKYAVGDLLIFREWSEAGPTYTGPALAVRVSHVARHEHGGAIVAMLSLCPEKIRFTIPTDQRPMDVQYGE